MVHGVSWGGVGGRAIRLGVRQGRHAGETWQSLQALGAMTACSHATVGLQASGQRGEGKVTLGLMGNSTWVQQAHDLLGEKTGI